ncbi:MAG: hypothetical protein K8F91_04280, partial [Candidatus Obscuribacterales bacterium]|nr:hypothetical protein [Candidatus Obscuribacterales bacterium]
MAQVFLDKLQRIIAIVYSAAVFLPITVGSVVLISGLCIWSLAILAGLVSRLQTSRVDFDRFMVAMRAPLAVPLLVFA